MHVCMCPHVMVPFLQRVLRLRARDQRKAKGDHGMGATYVAFRLGARSDVRSLTMHAASLMLIPRREANKWTTSWIMHECDRDRDPSGMLPGCAVLL